MEELLQRESRRCGRWRGLELASVRWWSARGGRGMVGGGGRPGRRGGGRLPGKTAPLKVTNLVGNLMTNFCLSIFYTRWPGKFCAEMGTRTKLKMHSDTFHATHSKSFPLSKSTLTAVESLREKCGRPLQLQPGCFHMHNVPPFHNHLCVHPPPVHPSTLLCTFAHRKVV